MCLPVSILLYLVFNSQLKNDPAIILFRITFLLSSAVSLHLIFFYFLECNNWLNHLIYLYYTHSLNYWICYPKVMQLADHYTLVINNFTPLQIVKLTRIQGSLGLIWICWITRVILYFMQRSLTFSNFWACIISSGSECSRLKRESRNLDHWIELFSFFNW